MSSGRPFAWSGVEQGNPDEGLTCACQARLTPSAPTHERFEVERSIWSGFDEVIRDPNKGPLDVLRIVGVYKRYLDAVEEEAVKAARRTGATWQEIAGTIGVTKQSAWQRLRHVEEAASKAETGEEREQLLTGLLRLSLPKPPDPLAPRDEA